MKFKTLNHTNYLLKGDIYIALPDIFQEKRYLQITLKNKSNELSVLVCDEESSNIRIGCRSRTNANDCNNHFRKADK